MHMNRVSRLAVAFSCCAAAMTTYVPSVVAADSDAYRNDEGETIILFATFDATAVRRLVPDALVNTMEYLPASPSGSRVSGGINLYLRDIGLEYHPAFTSYLWIDLAPSESVEGAHLFALRLPPHSFAANLSATAPRQSDNIGTESEDAAGIRVVVDLGEFGVLEVGLADHGCAPFVGRQSFLEDPQEAVPPSTSLAWGSLACDAEVTHFNADVSAGALLADLAPDITSAVRLKSGVWALDMSDKPIGLAER